MYVALGTVTLKDGEKVEAGLVDCPDIEWADRVEALLGHKGEVWQWQNRCCARQDLGIDARYYLLHREGVPFANMLTATFKGVGHFGHVFTQPEDRRKGAAHQLMGLLMEDFRKRDGHALFLGTGFDSAAYHIYRRHGFESLEPGSGQMEYYAGGDGESFREMYFAKGSERSLTLAPSWRHWPASEALFTSTFEGVVRCPSLGLLSRASTEGPFLPVLQRAQKASELGLPGDMAITERTQTGAVVAVARCSGHPLWPGKLLIDLYGHPGAQQEMIDCLNALQDADGGRRVDQAGCVSYSDGNPARDEALAAVGFRSTAKLDNWLAGPRSAQAPVQVTVWRND